MQGEKIGDESGKVTMRRTLSNPDGTPRVETTFEATGSILGVNHMTIGTYVSRIRPDGSLLGEGLGVVRGTNGVSASWVGQGVGTFRPDGGVGYRGAIFYNSASPQWSRLNSMAAIFEYEVDAQGNTKAQLWEWK